MDVEISVEQHGTATVVALTGRLDVVSSDDVERRLDELIARGSRHIVVDATGVPYISSAGLKAMLHAQKAAQIHAGTLRVVTANEFVTQVLRTTGFSRLVPTFATLPEALAAPAAQPG